VANRSELVLVRDVVIRYFHERATLDEVRETTLTGAKSMLKDGLTMEEMLIILKGAVRLAAEHVSRPSIAERAVWLRSQMTPWLVSMYLSNAANATGSDDLNSD
jgi:hypothetical protein